MTPHLKPCPFCGGEAAYLPDHTGSTSGDVTCSSCPATVGAISASDDDPRAVWDTRAPVAVKQLEWMDAPSHLDAICCDHFGLYQIAEDNVLFVGHSMDGRVYDTLDAAKAAAQADYERRILSAIRNARPAIPEPVPSLALELCEYLAEKKLESHHPEDDEAYVFMPLGSWEELQQEAKDALAQAGQGGRYEQGWRDAIEAAAGVVKSTPNRQLDNLFCCSAFDHASQTGCGCGGVSIREFLTDEIRALTPDSKPAQGEGA